MHASHAEEQMARKGLGCLLDEQLRKGEVLHGLGRLQAALDQSGILQEQPQNLHLRGSQVSEIRLREQTGLQSVILNRWLTNYAPLWPLDSSPCLCSSQMLLFSSLGELEGCELTPTF